MRIRPPQSREAQLAPADLARSLEAFFTEHPRAAVFEEGAMLFEMRSSRYALSTEHGRCVLHLWSPERNVVRTVTGLEERKERLRLQVRKLGANRPQSLELISSREGREPASRAAARREYARFLERVLAREFDGWKVSELRGGMDLEHSFGPGYVRGQIRQGQRAWAVIAAGECETQATIDGVLTLGILWLARCRELASGRQVFQGLKVIIPRGFSAVTQSRLAWMNRELGEWELFELSESTEEMASVDSGGGNLEMRLTQAFDSQAVLSRLAGGIERLRLLLPQGMAASVALRAKNPSEVAFTLHGLEFARVRQGFAANSFLRQDAITFGTGPNETALTEATAAWFQELAGGLFARRQADGAVRDPLYRLQPEGWLEEILSRGLEEIDPHLRADLIYSQVPAFAGGDRGMLDLLTVSRTGRVAALELKADEDLHLALQGLDYWIRVHKLNDGPADGSSSELERSGYFPGVALRKAPPLLYYVAPALRIHPATETILAHFSKTIPWTVVAINEGWRRQIKSVFRKRAAAAAASD